MHKFIMQWNSLKGVSHLALNHGTSSARAHYYCNFLSGSYLTTKPMWRLTWERFNWVSHCGILDCSNLVHEALAPAHCEKSNWLLLLLCNPTHYSTVVYLKTKGKVMGPNCPPSHNTPNCILVPTQQSNPSSSTKGGLQ